MAKKAAKKAAKKPAKKTTKTRAVAPQETNAAAQAAPIAKRAKPTTPRATPTPIIWSENRWFSRCSGCSRKRRGNAPPDNNPDNYDL